MIAARFVPEVSRQTIRRPALPRSPRPVKTFIAFAVPLLGILLAAASPVLRAAPAASTEPAPWEHAQIVAAWGRIVAHESEADKFGFDEAARRALIRGIEAGAKKAPPPADLDKILSDVTRFVDDHKAALREIERQKNLAAAPAYFAALKKNPAIVVLPDGLCLEERRTGTGPFPTPGQTVTVKYSARLIDGTEFDSTEQLGAVDLVLSRIVPGWSEGIQKMRTGGKMILHVPPALAFNDNDAAMLGIPAASIVVAEIELVGIKDTPPEDAPPPSAPIPPPEPPAGFSQEKIIEMWGWLLAQERGVAQARLDDADLKTFVAGLSAALEAAPASVDEKRIYPAVSQFVAGRQEAYRRAIDEQLAAETAAFFGALKKNAAVVWLPSGLGYEIIQPGQGDFPRADQRVRVNYIGRLIDGTIFDRTDPEIGPLEVDNNRVIRGWTEGIQKINRGGRIRLFIPPSLAYGNVATGGIPANSALIFEIELLDIREVPADER